MVKFPLIKGYYIANIDDLNWSICIDKTVSLINTKTGKPNKQAGTTIQNHLGYYSSLEQAWKSAVEMLAIKSENYSDLKETILALQKLKCRV
jgi:hypothetical protein